MQEQYLQLAAEHANEYELEDDGTVCASGVTTPKNVQFQIMLHNEAKPRKVELCLYQTKDDKAVDVSKQVDVRVQRGS